MRLYEDFKKMDVFPVGSIRPGRKAEDPTVHDLRGLKYLPNGKIKFKLRLNNDVTWEVLPQRINTQAEVKWVQMFPNPIPIKKRKFDDLQAMKHVIPKSCHYFYDALPCAED